MFHSRQDLARRLMAPWAALLLIGVSLVACSGGNSTASSAAGGGRLFIQADTVLGGANLASDESSCVQESQFERNEEIVWRAKVFDAATGQPLDDSALSSVEVKLADQTLTMKYGDHPHSNPTDSFWTVSFTIPADYPTGALSYTVVATAADGRTGEFDELNSAPSRLTVTEAVHPVVTPAPSSGS
jgi:hypothetical protein